jgi:excisionase family DNA binding protein
MSDGLISAHHVARLLGVKVSTVYAAAHSGRLPSVRLWENRRRPLLRFRRQDIESLIVERSRPVMTPQDAA